ncbi:MAG: hypothetical protein ACRDMU_07040 [Gaiellaceae bacterium]
MTDVCTHLGTIHVTALPGEDWCWCYEDEIAFTVDLAGAAA